MTVIMVCVMTVMVYMLVYGSYRVLFLTVPPNFQYQNEKQWTANQRFCSMKFSMYKRPRWLNNVFLFSTEIWAEQLKKHPVSYQDIIFWACYPVIFLYCVDQFPYSHICRWNQFQLLNLFANCIGQLLFSHQSDCVATEN